MAGAGLAGVAGGADDAAGAAVVGIAADVGLAAVQVVAIAVGVRCEAHEDALSVAAGAGAVLFVGADDAAAAAIAGVVGHIGFAAVVCVAVAVRPAGVADSDDAHVGGVALRGRVREHAGAGDGLADVGHTGIGDTVAIDEAGFAGLTGGTLRAATVDVGLLAVLDSVGAGGGHRAHAGAGGAAVAGETGRAAGAAVVDVGGDEGFT